MYLNNKIYGKKMSNLVFLQITDITWDSSSFSEDDLPRELEIQWNNGKWKNSEVSKFISNYYNTKVNSLKIKQLANKTAVADVVGVSSLLAD